MFSLMHFLTKTIKFQSTSIDTWGCIDRGGFNHQWLTLNLDFLVVPITVAEMRETDADTVCTSLINNKKGKCMFHKICKKGLSNTIFFFCSVFEQFTCSNIEFCIAMLNLAKQVPILHKFTDEQVK